MRFEKFTNRLQQALSDAQSLAIGKDHTAIEGIHLLATLLEEAFQCQFITTSRCKPT